MLPINKFSRPGTKRMETEGIVFHWTSVAGQTAEQVEQYFSSLAEQSVDDDIPDRYGSAHAVIGIEGEFIQLIPWAEVAYHAGGQQYQWEWREAYPEYSQNTATGTPNYALIGIELCHPDETGEFTDATLCRAREVARDLMVFYTLGTGNLYRHYDITGKDCPRYWVNNKDKWTEFVESI